MKRKTLLSLAIVISMLLAVLPIMAVKASPGNTLEVRFEDDSNEITYAPGSDFVVKVYIALDPGVQIDFYAVELHWDVAVLELKTGTAADVHEGTFMNSHGGTVFVVADPVPGSLPDTGCGYLTGGPATGSGTLFTVDFHCKAPGDGNIIIFDPAPPGGETFLLDGASLVNIDVVVNGLVHQPAPPPTPPHAAFTPLDGALIDVCTDVVLDATASTSGYDTLPDPGHNCPIDDYMWQIDFHNGTILELHGVTAGFHCDGPGLVTITLTVFAPDPTPPTHVDYVPTDSETHNIMQVAPSVGAGIDVYTDRNGEGPLGVYPFGWSDAYGPQEEVCVYAKVTYNDEPVEYKPVGFEVIDPNGYVIDFRVAFTDASGVATACFRIPWQGSSAGLSFGIYSITGTVDVAGTVVSDTVKFKYGWLLQITGLTVTPGSLHKLEFTTIDVEIESICMISKNGLLTIVACDEPGVPIGIAAAAITVDPLYNIFMGYTITIPTWAFVGTGHIYANLFTTYPTAGGIPYCPEATAILIIQKTI